MTTRLPGRRDLTALAFAACATLVTVFINGPIQTTTEHTRQAGPADPALAGLLDANAARAEAQWWLEQDELSTKLSFAPEHDRLVWRVRGNDRSVLLDAATGEALAFEFE
jgi:hypothetical protein